MSEEKPDIIIMLEQRIAGVNREIDGLVIEARKHFESVIAGEDSSLTKVQTCLNAIRGKKHERKAYKDAIGCVSFQFKQKLLKVGGGMDEFEKVFKEKE